MESLKTTLKKQLNIFNNCYVNIVEPTSGKRLSSIGNCNSKCQVRATVKKDR